MDERMNFAPASALWWRYLSIATTQAIGMLAVSSPM